MSTAEKSVKKLVTLSYASIHIRGESSTRGLTGVSRTRYTQAYSLPDINYKLVSSAFTPQTYCMIYDRHSTLWKIRNNCFSKEKKVKKDKWR